MKLNKKQEQEIMQVYDTWMNSYLNGDVKTYDSFLDVDYRFIGSTNNEEFLNKKDTTNFLKATADQLAGKTEIRNSIKTIEQLDGLVFITDLFDAYFLNGDDWAYYGRFRFTSAMRKNKNGWRFLYQHFSTPDAKAQEGETLGTEQISKENQELRDAIQRRTVELEQKNRELEIETALEKVRARSMAMYKSEELADLSLELVKQVQNLGVATWFCAFNIYDDDPKGSIEWGSNGQGTFPEYRTPREGVFLRYYKAGQKGETLLVNEIGEKECPSHYEYLCNLPGVGEQLLKMKDAGIPFPKSQIDHVAYFKYGYVLFITYEPVPESHDIFKRFAKVFEQTYTRFLDLQKAEEQARESKIEAALERVRSASMAMHKSEEMQIVVDTIYEQLNALNFEMHAVGMSGAMNPKKGYEVWAGGIGLKAPLQIPYSEATKVQRDYNKVLIERTELFAKTYKSKIKKEYIDFLLHNNKFPSFLEKLMVESQAFSTTLATSKNSGMQILRYTEKPYTDSENAILLRFAKVFEQAYIRFMDLQKAEAQTREAQIETALERVRSRSMAMHNSNEIGDVALVLFQQLKSLGGELWGTGFGFCKKDSDVDEYWFANEKGIMPQLKIPNTVDPAHKQMYQGWKKNLELLSIVKDGKALKDHYKYMLTVPDVQPIFQGMLDNGIAFPKWQKWHAAYFKYGYLLVISTEEYKNEAVFKRFAKVFEQAYTRFLDLQKAEAQAKEAQIEAALERVRSQSMGMQTSKDLSKVTTEMFNQLRQFGGDLYATGIVFCDKQKGHVEQWHSLPDAGMISPFIVPIDLDYIHQYRYDQWRKGTELFSIEIPSDFIAQHFNDIFKLPSAQVVLKEFEANKIPMPPRPDWEIDYGATFKHGYILVSSLQPFKETEILPRFAKVFEQTYTRFLDLKKAEAQAKEAQIETALERVRSRSMAMHKSEELKDVVKEIFDQMAHLKINADHAGIVVDYEPKKDFHFWVADNQDIPARITVPFLDLPWDKQFTEAKKKGTDFFTTQLNFEEKNSFYKKLLPHIKGLTKKAKDYYLNCPGLAASTVIQTDIGLYIENFSGIPFSDSENSILMRFGKVFQQTYTRFLDLQKAEAQAREAQIENALEKVRSRTMAMQKSSELPEAANNLFLQVQELGIPAWSAGYCIWEDDQKSATAFMSSEGVIQKPFVLPNIGVGYNFSKPLKKGEIFHVGELGGNLIKKHYEFMRTLPVFGEVIDGILEAGHSLPTFQIFHICYFKYGYVMFITYESVPKAHDIFKRFAKVFEQTYTRFLDLKKAEAQTREAKIEMALEKVRSRTMAMQKGEEVKDVVVLLYKELIALGVTNFASCGYVEINEETQLQSTWVTSPGGDSLGLFYLPLTGDVYFDKRYEAWKKQQTVFHQTVAGKERRKHLEYAITTFNSKEAEEMVRNQFPDPTVFYCFNFSHGYLHLVAGSYLKEEEEALLARFTRVFEQTYARFLDLEKAEAQAREALIENALEKVRSRSLAMHKPGELQEVIALVAEKLKELGVIYDAGGVILCTYFPDNKDVVHWIAVDDFSTSGRYFVPYFDNPIFNDAWDSKIKGDAYFSKEFPVEAKNDFFKQAFEKSDYRNFPADYKQHVLKADKHNLSAAWSKNSAIIIPSLTGAVPSESDAEIMKRFAKVFEQAYIRFMDLQKAEAQAREAQIEAALEKVRSRTMAMHKSKEMLEVIGVVSEQLQQLNLNFDTVSFAKNNQEGDFTFWITSKGQPKPIQMEVPTLDSPILKGVYKAQKKGIAFLADVFSSKENREWHEHLIKYSDLKHFPDKIKDFILNAPGFARSSFLLKNIDLYVGNYRAIPFTDEENSIFRRFAHVFEQSYTRFLDLQKAENQAREAQIEGALERVRSKTMAMHNSEDLEDIVVSLFEEVMNLGHDKSIRCGIGILEGHEGMQTRSVNSNSDGTVDLKVGMLNMTIHPMLIGLKKAWKNGRKGYSYEYTAKDVRKYYEALNKEPEYPFNADLKTLPKQEFHRSFFFSSGIIFAFSENPISEESSKILARFAAVFGQTYRRFLDLQKAEAQAREATKQASLDRVRGQIASMRSTDDLDRITPLVWNELTTMDVPFIRCGVFIMDEPTKIVEVYLSAPDGHSLGVLHLKFNADPLTKNTVDHWRKGRIFKKHWNREDFLSWTQSLIEQGQISDKNTYQGAVDPPESLDLHFMPFTQGMLYVGSEHPLVEEHIELAQSLADAFAIAYARYEDFTKLEKAKQSVEATLSELKATQNQLVQSEKMASLGELTAGIAHEIQNPLNFVNNFSEVSGELIEEMNEEIEKGDMEEAKAIANDVKQNLEKILHHGKRADAIVKGMLQHSRSSTGIKEPTDINSLADEYLRLAYHGLRAKDKSFNATMKTDYDDSLEKVNVIPQDIGRVILNLITNAFYVVDEKKKQLKNGYEPTVSVSTKKGAGKIEISVMDNGNGIPEKVKEKIFQPFFTTKPTGKGTGLGLSMSYDIVNKGHGGELTVETTEGIGTTFTIALPMV